MSGTVERTAQKKGRKSKVTKEPDAIWDRDAMSLLRALLQLRKLRDAKRFLRDLMTEDEIHMVVLRWRVAGSLAAGKTYHEIEADTGLSSRTIARISRWLKQGRGGYQLMLRRREEMETR